MTAQAPPVWDPHQYLRHSGHRLRPLYDLLARVPADLPAPPGRPGGPRVADLGCGPGGPTALLAERWPDAHITGYDNSPTMLAEARTHAREGRDADAGRGAGRDAGAGPDTGSGEGRDAGSGAGRLDFAHADLTDWRPPPGERFGLLFSNAALQWVPGHVDNFPAWTEALDPGGVLAFQVPGNFGAPSHTLLHELRNAPRWHDRLGSASRADAVLDPAGYFGALAPLGCEVDAWETTYLHLLPGEDPVLDWVKGTALRPVLTLLDDDPEARDAFLAEYAAALRTAYPRGPHGTVFPFRRIFVVARKR